MNDSRPHSCAFGDDLHRRNDVNIFNAQQIELDMRLGVTKTITLPTITSTSASRRSAWRRASRRRSRCTANLNFGFGVDVEQRLLLRHRRRHADQHERTTTS